MSEKKKLVILSGPTAAGKSALSISLAKDIGGEIISADSMQVYKYLDIGSDKISKEAMKGVPHYLVDVLDPKDDFNVARFQTMAKEAMEKIYSNGHIPIVVGGTGFYIQALLYGIDFEEEQVDPALRARLEEEAERLGKTAMHKRLEEKDPESAAAIPEGNLKRVLRALEYYESTGEKFSDYNANERRKEAVYDFFYFVVTKPREELYKGIEERIDLMIERGLAEEVKALVEMGVPEEANSMKGIGYRQLIPYLKGEITLEKAIYDIKLDTRHFAKRQLTWFRRERDVRFIEKDKFSSDEDVLKYMEDEIRKRWEI
ncbi:MAG: tRNA (adenosine(37)-N6)-dimethylallyltransferase MiaA [Lachnospiraceae bacterium]|nr:tRNA (adenosine(37)-N6)-dimethylallyltransferase MiaA [Lachnospiraceae bacterium]